MAFAQCLHDFTMSHGLMMSLLLAGLVGGLSHCTSMCAPFVLAQMNDYEQEKGKPFLQKLMGAALLPYHLGRMTTYVVLAILAHSFINVAFIFSDAKAMIAAPLLMIAATLFIVSVFPFFRKVFPWAGRTFWQLPSGLLNRMISPFIAGDTVFRRYMLGSILGMMPCGLLASVLLAASTAPSIEEAAFAMIAFAVGTFPSLLLVALGGRALGTAYPNLSVYIKQGAMAVSSLWLFALAGIMVL